MTALFVVAVNNNTVTVPPVVGVALAVLAVELTMANVGELPQP